MLVLAVWWAVVCGVFGFTWVAYLTGPHSILAKVQGWIQSRRWIPEPVRYALQCMLCSGGWLSAFTFPLGWWLSFHSFTWLLLPFWLVAAVGAVFVGGFLGDITRRA